MQTKERIKLMVVFEVVEGFVLVKHRADMFEDESKWTLPAVDGLTDLFHAMNFGQEAADYMLVRLNIRQAEMGELFKSVVGDDFTDLKVVDLDSIEKLCQSGKVCEKTCKILRNI